MIISVPEFELKLALAHSVYLHAEVAGSIHQRLIELQASPKAVALALSGDQVDVINIAASGDSKSLVGSYLAVLLQLRADHEAYQVNTNALLDRPTILALRRHQLDIADAIDWFEAASTGWSALGDQTEPRVGSSAADRCDGASAYSRPTACARDGRFEVFHQGRQYRDALDEGLTEYERDRLELVRVQRDEIDAIETFANVIYDLASISIEQLRVLARFVADEARHAEAGQLALQHLGFDPFAVPCSVIGINVRSPMPPELAFTQINTFGELSIVSRLREQSKAAVDAGDEVFERFFDFIHADELTHVRQGRRLMEQFAADGDVEALQDQARQAAARRLFEEGVLGEDYALTLSREQIWEIMGE